MIDHTQIVKFIRRLSEVYAQNEAYLTELDSAIGDADHGANLNRGFKKSVVALDENTPQSIDEVLKLVSMQLIKTVGGASGPLLGTFFLKASIACKGLESLKSKDLFNLFLEGIEGVKKLGKAEQGEKTMLDTLIPALEAMEQHQNESIPTMLEHACSAAENGMNSTIDLIASKGRASYLGERSKGHQDPGATSSFLLLETAKEVFSAES